MAAREHGSDDFLLIDVREPDEHARGTIDGSVLLPLADILTESGRSVLLRHRPVIVYCLHEGRARQAARALMVDGFDSVCVLEGGYANWSEHRPPTAPGVAE